MILLQEAERAKDIANIFGKFLDHERDPALRFSIDQLDALSRGLKDLARLVNAQDAGISRDFRDDLELLEQSVAFTLGDLWTMIGSMPEQSFSIDYRDTWKDICRHCRSTRMESLPMRLETYSQFCSALCRELRREPRGRQAKIEDLRDDIRSLRRAQLDNRRLITAADAIEDLEMIPVPRLLAAPLPIRPTRSTERVRPPELRTTSPTESNRTWESIRYAPVPDPPLSPVSPTQTFSAGSQASSCEIETKHWIGTVFKNQSSTEFADKRNEKRLSQCLGGDRRDGDSWPKGDYEEVLNIKFPGSLRLHYYVRGKDARAKVVCEWPDGRNRKRWACLPLSDLHSRRSESILYFCRPISGMGNSIAWGIFKFPTIEFLVIFHCAFLSLRSHDDRKHTRDMFDRELDGETRVFAAAIRDNGFRHALRIYRDRNTGAIRLEAAVLEGDMKDTPIWTAFITHHITSPTWARRRREDSPTIYLSALTRHIFSSAYQPHIAANGAHILDFDVLKDADEFAKTIKEFGEEYRKNP